MRNFTIHKLAIFIIFLQIMYTSQQISVIFFKTENVGQNHILDICKLFWLTNLFYLLLELVLLQVWQVINIGAPFLQAEFFTEVLIFNFKLIIWLRRVLMFLLNVQKVFSELHVADDNFSDHTDACN